MASSIIHFCVAKEINKHLKRNENQILIGSVAPDISQRLNEDKNKFKSHFLDKDDDIPNLNRFLYKYSKQLNNDFILGYYIHLCTDYLWYKYFMANFIKDDYVLFLNGDKYFYKNDGDILDIYNKYVYSDYNNLDIDLINKYDLHLNNLYQEIPFLKNNIEEIPIEKTKILIDDIYSKVKNNHKNAPFIFDFDMVDKFIIEATNTILENIKKV